MRTLWLFMFLWMSSSLLAQVDSLLFSPDTLRLATSKQAVPIKFVYTPANSKAVDTPFVIRLSLEETTVSLAASRQKKGKKIKGTLKTPLLTVNQKGHIALGKAIYHQLYQAADSVLTFGVALEAQPAVDGQWTIDFRSQSGRLTDFVEQSAYYYWLEKRQLYRDSVLQAQKDSARSVAMLQTSEKHVNQCQQQVDKTQQALAQYEKEKPLIEAIKKTSTQVDKGMARIKNGEELSKEEMMTIADATGERAKNSKKLKAESPKAYTAMQSQQEASKTLSYAEQQLQANAALLQKRQKMLTRLRQQWQNAKKQCQQFNKRAE